MALALHLRKATAEEPHTTLAHNSMPTLNAEHFIRILGHCHAHSALQGRRERGMQESKSEWDRHHGQVLLPAKIYKRSLRATPLITFLLDSEQMYTIPGRL
jgi:hypothetical protein